MNRLYVFDDKSNVFTIQNKNWVFLRNFDCGPFSPSPRGRWVRTVIDAELGASWAPSLHSTPPEIWKRAATFFIWLFQNSKEYEIIPTLDHVTNTAPHHFLKAIISCLTGLVTGPIISRGIPLFTLTKTLWSWRGCKTSNQHMNTNNSTRPISHWCWLFPENRGSQRSLGDVWVACCPFTVVSLAW